MLASRITTAGFSAGGYLAGAYATYDALFKSAIVLHSQVRANYSHDAL
jgi:dienelactone hydrolase